MTFPNAQTLLRHPERQDAIAVLSHLFITRGASLYSGEPVSQLEHALQCAALAEANAASPSLITAALLHDVGHLLYDEMTESAHDSSIGDRPHEYAALPLLNQWFGAEVMEPIRFHVEAKRYLCATEAGYYDALSTASQLSLAQQGGAFTLAAAQQFVELPFARDAIQLRYWDDQAKVCGGKTPDLQHFLTILTHCQLSH